MGEVSNLLSFFGRSGFSDGTVMAMTVAAGGLSGGLSASIAGGKFVNGAKQGLITSGMNHMAHSFAKFISRPKWADVYEAYPKDLSGMDDMETTEVFKMLFGEGYDSSMFTNAYATRVSVALNGAGLDVRKDFIIQQGDLKGKGIIASAAKLKDWLTKEFGTADEIIKGPTDLASVSEIINGRNGIYIMVPQSGYFSTSRITGHATLWIGANNDVVGGHNYADGAKEIYFWNLD